MIDAPKLLRDFLVADANMLAGFGSRIWAEVDTPPPEYQPGQGSGLCFKVRDGNIPSETVAILGRSFQFKVYASDESQAQAGYRTLFEALNFKSNVNIKMAQEEVAGQTLREPDSNWPFVLTFFHVLFANP
jgi:hypothetical protein